MKISMVLPRNMRNTGIEFQFPKRQIAYHDKNTFKKNNNKPDIDFYIEKKN